MPKYDEWKSGSLPELQNHSKCKHDILRDYLLRYLLVLHTGTLRYGNKKFNVTVVDGCAGGGKYQFGSQIVDGSPFVILNTVREAEMTIQTIREKSGATTIDVNIDVILVEKDNKTANFLTEELRKGERLTEKVKIVQGDFNEEVPSVIDFIKQKSQGQPGRCLFFLDQYGYSKIGLNQVWKILASLKSEVILTFAVDYLVDHLSGSKRSMLENLGFMPSRINELFQLAKNTKESRRTIEHVLAQHIQSATGAKFYTPFFIRGNNTHRGYWLVHLSNHYRAQDEMVSVHWEKGNDLTHYGSAGMDMLGYLSGKDENYTKQLPIEEFRFDQFAKEKSKNCLRKELPELIYQEGQIKYCDLLKKSLNHTPANREIINEVIEEGMESKELSIPRREAKNIKDSDIIQLAGGQKNIFPFGTLKK